MAENKYVTDNRRSSTNLAKKATQFVAKIKNLNTLIAIAAACIVIIFTVTIAGGEKKKTETVDTQSYYAQVENRLSEVLSEISGAGAVKVMINYSGTSELVTATTTNTSQDKTTDNGSSSSRVTESKTESVSPVIIQQNGEDKPIIVKEILPDIVGVIVVAEGAKDMSVRINLISAVQTLLNVSSDKVEIFTMKK